MTLVWLIVWLVNSGNDPLVFSPAVNDWATWLLICAAVDLSITVRT